MTGISDTVTLPAILFWGIVTFSLIVVVHELGHFLAARAFGVRVHEFMIGLPGPAIRFKGKKTAFGITAIPLGGYVRIAGMEPGEEDPLLARALGVAARSDRIDDVTLAVALGIETDKAQALLRSLDDWGSIRPTDDDDFSYLPVIRLTDDDQDDVMLDRERQHTFRGKKTWQRIVILSMGVVLNLIFAIIAFMFLLSGAGYSATTTIIDPMEDSPAMEAGVLPGDQVIAINDVSITQWSDLLDSVAVLEPGDEIVMGIRRQETDIRISVIPDDVDGHPFLGISTRFKTVRMPLGESLSQSLQWTGMVFAAMADLFDPQAFKTTVKDARGVVGISVEAANAASEGPVYYLWLVALLSLSLGALNIFPIPPLDGGRIVLELVERLRGRPIRREWSLGFSAIGALLIFSLIGYIAYLDVLRYIVGT